MPCSKESALEMLIAAMDAGRLAHAHLFTGSAGSGKTWIARQLAGRLLGCEPEAVIAHPDAHFVQPESKSRRIVIDQIRDLDRVIQRKPLLSPNKVAIITDADRLQPSAANAFLKTLEEPPPGSLILLTSALPEAILETVLSRCVETSLRGGGITLGPDAQQLLDALGKALLGKEERTVADAFQLTRAVQEVLSEIRAQIVEEHTQLLKQESAKYKTVTDGGDWLEEREAQIKALSESAALRERERLLGTFLVAFGGALRVSHGGTPVHPICEHLSASYTTDELLSKIEALHALQHRLAMNVNEALVLEAGMLDIVLGNS